MTDQIFVLSQVLAPMLTGRKAPFDHPEMDETKIPPNMDPVTAVMQIFKIKPAAKADRAMIVTDSSGRKSMRP